ncbi:hypothetical protein A1O3_02200 [Capronia epimyces CBS 606.96]|uniref:G-protein coupled receptors family 3 profile domain-containing protein n=1 Tax=Capronia epimyces CBS 606.96 TaxID=1182542 RepID=W9YIQ0_9EURO|nr:uncharacterized protein A1O3_02200 [Capronia epimyces CBS 606.96]EXJ89136.1 hypothetical protein A1O3_02200 [Capronia epimyces CBS 606.96]
MMMRVWIVCLLVSLVCAETCEPEGPKEEGCPIVGNSDYYGLGVRMGIYSAWLTSWFANNFLPEEIIGSLETNSIFLLALFATVFFYSVQKNGIRVVDVLVIHQLCIGFLFSVMSLWGYRTMYYRTEGPGGRRHFGGFGTHFRLVLMGMITSYGVWFWVEGVEDGLSDCDRRRNCGGLQTFFIVPMRVDSWSTRGVQLTINIAAAAYYGIMTLAAIAGGIAFLVRFIQGKDAHWELIKEQDSTINLTKRELTKWYIALSCFNLFWIVFAILSIEFTLNLNHMNNVVGSMGLVGPGQLIPLAIGLLSLTRVLWILGRQHIPWLKEKDEDCCPTVTESTGPAAQEKYMSGIGLTMTNTPSLYSPLSPNTKMSSSSPGQASSTTMVSSSNLPPLPATTSPQKRSLPHRMLLAWLPWLGLFEWSKHSLTPSLGHYSRFGVHHGQIHDHGQSQSHSHGHDHRRDSDSEAGIEGARKTQTPDSAIEFERMQQPQGQGFKARFESIRSPSFKARFDSIRSPGRRDNPSASASAYASMESPSTSLLSSPPQLPPGQKGLMYPQTSSPIELQPHRRSGSSDTTLRPGLYDGRDYEDEGEGDDYD